MIMKTTELLANVHQCNITFSDVHVQVRFFKFLLLSFMPARAAAKSIKTYLCFRLVCTSGWFVRMKNSNCTPNTNNYV